MNESYTEDLTWINATEMTPQSESTVANVAKATTTILLTNEEKTFNYIMTGLSFLLLLVIAIVAKGLHSWQKRRKPFTVVPMLKAPENSKEAWSGNTSKQKPPNTEKIQAARSLKLTNDEPTSGKLSFPKPNLPQQLTTLHIQDTDDEHRSMSSAIRDPVIKEIDMDRISNNIDNYLTTIESHLQVPSSARFHYSPK